MTRHEVRSGLGGVLAVMALVAALAPTAASAQSRKTPPYWASIAKTEAMMRVGPSQDYPANWLYKRQGLPVKVVTVYQNWRKVEDPDGTVGWFHVRLLRDDPTAIVKGGEAAMRDKPSEESRLLYRLSAGVLVKISGCASGWCAVEVDRKSGYVLSRSLWGATAED